MAVAARTSPTKSAETKADWTMANGFVELESDVEDFVEDPIREALGEILERVDNDNLGLETQQEEFEHKYEDSLWQQTYGGETLRYMAVQDGEGRSFGRRKPLVTFLLRKIPISYPHQMIMPRQLPSNVLRGVLRMRLDFPAKQASAQLLQLRSRFRVTARTLACTLLSERVPKTSNLPNTSLVNRTGVRS